MSKAIITEQHLHDIADAIIAKGGATAAMTPSQMPAAIANIPSGGEDGKWTIPSDWPDIEAFVKSDPVAMSYTYRMAVLYGKGVYLKKIDPTKFMVGRPQRIYDNFGNDYDVNSATSEYWQQEESGYKIVVFCGNNPFVLSYTRPYAAQFLLWIHLDNMSAQGGMHDSLSGNAHLQYVSAGNIDFTNAPANVKGFDWAFRNDLSLRKVKMNIDIKAATSISQMFMDCRNLVDLSEFKIKCDNITEANMCFLRCTSLRAIPDIGAISGAVAGKTVSILQYCEYCEQAEEMPAIDFSNKTQIRDSLFQGNFSCKRIKGGVIDFSSQPAGTIVFGQYTGLCLMDLPTIRFSPLNGNTNAWIVGNSYSNCVNPESFAKFDSNGNLVGGMVYNLNDVTNADGYFYTLIGFSSVRSAFTSSEAQAIIDLCNSRGYALSDFTA